MNYYKLQEFKKDVYPAIILDQILSARARTKFRNFIAYIILAFLLYFALPIHLSDQYVYLIRSIFVLILCGYFCLLLLEMMYLSYYFEENRVDIRVLKILSFSSKKSDISAAFFKSELGKYVLYRLGFTQTEINEFLEKKTDIVTRNEFEIIENDDNEVSFAEFGYSLAHFDSDLSNMLRKKGINIRDFKEALDWVARMDQMVKEAQRWWKKDNLLRIPSIGKNLSFGRVFYLETFGHNIYRDTSYVQLGEKWRMYKSSVRNIERVLVRRVNGNLIITAREEYLAMDVIASLAKEIYQGTTLSELENKRIFVLDVNLLLTLYEDQKEFEVNLEKILGQAADAGNVILVIPNFADFVQNTHSLDVDVKDILREALKSTDLQVIVTTSERSFHEVLETDLDLMNSFEKIHINETDSHRAISVVENEIIYIENKEKVFFTYQAVKKIIESADRYFADSSLLHKSIDIMYEIIPAIKQEGSYIITAEDVDRLVSSKTGISLGKITEEESQKLSHIKEKMHERVVGQDKAVDAVCDAMLRARTGLANPKRPLASFLFVGPTGVGKTETAKALAEIFFNDETNMLRSDMSEYSDEGALIRMIGEEGRVGIFASKVRERGHGVLLLDEFEKASREIHDLFLQILDEGFFTDGRGEKVVMRNFIIIATSNAGSEIFAKHEGTPVSKQELVDYIISNHSLRTELLNRFDEVVLFDSLSSQMLTNIAHLAVSRLTKRLSDKGIVLKETPELISYLIKVGTNSTFGAREINRVIIKEIETKIAQALVLRDLFEGDTISFTTVNNGLEIQKYT